MAFREHLAFPFLIAALCPAISVAGAERPQIEREEPWSCYFGGRTATLHYRIAAPADRDRRAAWSFAVQGQVVARREATVGAGPESAGILEIALDLPSPRPGLAIPATVTVAMENGARLEHPLWILPEDPFEGCREALRGMRLVLFDPEKKTSHLLERYRVPFALVRDMASIAAAERGLVLIGEGVSFRQWRTLPETLVRTAARGLPVVCLAPSVGEMRLPGIGDGRPPVPAAIFLRRSDAITALDKRLDLLWPPDGKTVASGIAWSGSRSGIVGEVTAGEGWPWVEAAFPGEGRLLVCGFALMAKWENGPAPRYLFKSILSYMSDRSEMRGLHERP
jgi:hypothetical protein